MILLLIAIYGAIRHPILTVRAWRGSRSSGGTVSDLGYQGAADHSLEHDPYNSGRPL